jgi:hypothetical protein
MCRIRPAAGDPFAFTCFAAGALARAARVPGALEADGLAGRAGDAAGCSDWGMYPR